MKNKEERKRPISLNCNYHVFNGYATSDFQITSKLFMLLRTQCKTFCTHIHVDVRIMQHRHSFDVEDSQGILKDDVTMIAPIDNLKVKSNLECFIIGSSISGLV